MGDTFVVTLDVDTTVALRGGPVQLAYSKDRLSLVDVQQGDLLRQGGAATAFSQTVAAAEGTARTAVLRSEASGVTGKTIDGIFRVSTFSPVVLTRPSCVDLDVHTDMCQAKEAGSRGRHPCPSRSVRFPPRPARSHDRRARPATGGPSPGRVPKPSRCLPPR